MRRAVELALDAARGLAYLHKRKPSPIVHRDLKPANLMISGNLYQVGITLDPANLMISGNFYQMESTLYPATSWFRIQLMTGGRTMSQIPK